MRISILYMALIGLILTCCKNNPEKETNNEEINPMTTSKQSISSNAESTGKALDMLLTSCGDYSYFENYFRIPYNGCLYNPENNPTNKLGWADIVLIPEQPFKSNFLAYDENYDRQDSIVSVINKMSVNELKEQFKILVFVVDKQYLSYTENAEINYYPDLPYKLKMYEYKIELKEWNLENSAEVNKESDKSKWVEAQLEKKVADTTQ